MRESNSHEDLAKVPGSHYINPPLNIKFCLILFLVVNQTIPFTPCTTAMMFTTWWNILCMTISNFFWSFSFFTKSPRHIILLKLVSVGRIELPPHAPKARMIPFHHTELFGASWWIRTTDNLLVRQGFYHWTNDAWGVVWVPTSCYNFHRVGCFHYTNDTIDHIETHSILLYACAL